MTRTTLILFLFSFLGSVFPAQSQISIRTEQHNKKIGDLYERLRAGDKEAIPEFGKLLDDKTKVTEYLGYHQIESLVSDIARRCLEEWCFFEPEIDLEKTDAKSFYAFWKSRQDDIQFSSLTRAYFIMPPEQRTCNYSLKDIPQRAAEADEAFDAFVKEIRMRIKWGHTRDALNAIDDISQLRSARAFDFLSKGLTGNFDSLPFPDLREAQEACAWALRRYPSETTIGAIRMAKETGKIDEETALSALQHVTNIPMSRMYESGTYKYNRMLTLIDSLQTLERMRKFGYRGYFDRGEVIYPSTAEDYGKILAQAGPFEFTLRANVLSDLIATHDPLALKYIGAQVMQQRNTWNVYSFSEKDEWNSVVLLRQLTRIQLFVQNEKGELVHELNGFDYTALLNYSVYWLTHYSDYAWDEKAGRFVNTKEEPASADEVDALIGQLNAENADVALNAYRRLTECDAEKVRLAAAQNEKLIDQADSKHFGKLPMFSGRRLPEQAALTEFCRKNNYSYKARPAFLPFLDSLDKNLPLVERYRLESRIIASMNFDDATALEYLCSLNDADNSSAGRILDEFYGRNFTTMCSDPKQLRLYLKKTQLYKRFGIVGICNTYIWKFYNCSEDVKEKLRALKTSESDADVLASINAILEGKTGFKGPNTSKPKDHSEAEKYIVEKVREIVKMGEPHAKAKAFLSLSYKTGFDEWLSEPAKSKVWMDTLRPALEYYLRKDDLDEYTRGQLTLLLSYAGLVTESYDKQLESALGMSEKTATRVLMNMSYAQVPVVMKYWDRIKAKKVNDRYSILRHDLGLPLDEKAPGWKDTLLNRMSRLSEKDVYRAYLRDLGMDVFDAKGELDYLKVHRALRYGPGLSFAGSVTSASPPLYTLMRFLELEHNTRLGFPPYFYHASRQSGMIHSPHDRMQAWINFFQEKKLLKVPENFTPSFAGEANR